MFDPKNTETLSEDELDSAVGGAPSQSQCEPDDSGTSKPKPSRPSRPRGGTDGAGLGELPLSLNFETIKPIVD